MSEIVERKSDFNDGDRQKLAEYVEAGKPGVAKVTAEIEHNMLELYMQGATYSEISMQLNIKKPVVLFFANRGDWFGKKEEHIQILMTTLAEKTAIAHVEGVSFLVELIHAQQNHYRKKLRRYAETGNDVIMETMDLKPLQTLFRAYETLQKLQGVQAQPPPSIQINVPAGSQVSGNSQSVNVTAPPDIAATFEMLTKLRREKELKSLDENDDK